MSTWRVEAQGINNVYPLASRTPSAVHEVGVILELNREFLATV